MIKEKEIKRGKLNLKLTHIVIKYHPSRFLDIVYMIYV